MKQAILGAGNIGSLLAKELRQRNIEVKILGRNAPVEQSEGVSYSHVDAENNSLIEATKDVKVLYATLAIPYDTQSWQRSWPLVMHNLIEAAKTNGFKLVFLDNVYMYGRVDGPMTEDTPYNPVSKKGEVRASIASMLLKAMKHNEINATIGRSADFYGPNTRISDRFFQGAYHEGIATWMGDPKALRTMSYTLDNAKALAILGNNDRANQEVWHMPAAPAMTGLDFISLASRLLSKELRVVTVPGPTPENRSALLTQMPEIAEMMYQYDYSYIFDSSKFQRIFGMKPTSYEEGFMNVFSGIKNN